MVTAVGLTNGFNNPYCFGGNSASQYMEASVFGLDPAMNMGMYPVAGGYGFGVGTPQMYNYMENSMDNWTALQFGMQGNQYALGSYQEVMAKSMPALAHAIRNGDYGTASQIYRDVYDAISMKNGEELVEQGQRVAYDRAIKATINQAYRAYNGTTLVSDIEATGEGYFANGFLQGLTLNGHHKNSAEETISYMTGQGIEGYTGKKIVKGVGKLTGIAVTGGALVGAGFLIGGPVGALIGGGLALAKLLLSDNTTKTVTASSLAASLISPPRTSMCKASSPS